MGCRCGFAYRQKFVGDFSERYFHHACERAPLAEIACGAPESRTSFFG